MPGDIILLYIHIIQNILRKQNDFISNTLYCTHNQLKIDSNLTKHLQQTILHLRNLVTAVSSLQ